MWVWVLGIIGLVGGLAGWAILRRRVLRKRSRSGPWYVERSIVIGADVEEVFPLINDPKRWPGWDLNSSDGSITGEVEYRGAACGETSERIWRGTELGYRIEGSLRITESCAGEGIQYDMTVANGRWGYASQGGISLTRHESGSEVTWSDSGEMRGGLLSAGRVEEVEAIVEGRIREGLERLKATVEGGDISYR